MNYTAVFDSIVTSNGASYNLHHGILNPESGFMVALAKFEKIYPGPANKEELQDYVIDYIFSNKHVWNMIKENPDTLFIGFWIHNDQLYVDLAENVSDYGTAMALAIDRYQIAFYDCKNKMDVKIVVHYDVPFQYNEHPMITVQD